ncbi:Na(+)/H(+) antiporter NhaA [Nocardioides flavus (ex Wang et al. 2016)]|uniref:Na(+)/H(+) antiporter NhaA n=1 Tax=Nocardioides flavus (ex Wang et al. 2016) TaxID=2058780 RepID=A0ABQ3HHN9_9ACTN|nr:Na+/H+ antiporter NhaA [Nocardioides flavus (ex Wang et al. 2016)]GHE16209.1 Na(+)/H(+) antiporter NhaA [Nocardioides flavus (ex Wang et al. 2016)]
MATPSKPQDPRPDDALWKSGPVYIASDKPLARLVARPLREFLRVEAAGSLLLLLAAAVALLWANSVWGESYDALWHSYLTIDAGPLHLEETLQHWVNDALMVIFFFVVGLEIKYELVNGDLRDPKTAALPIVAAIGGMAVPALLYVALNPPGSDGAAGWGIPMATDIAFAVGVLGILGRRIPSAARLFLLTLAIVDDIGAILVIAVFYTSDLSLTWLAVALVLLGLMVAARVLRVWAIVVYAILGVGTWFALLESGVHATLAGVAIGLLAPARPLLEEEVAREYATKALRDRHLNPDELARLRFLLKESVSVVERLISTLHPVSAYVVLPIFALANAGVELGALSEVFTEPVGLGIILGLVVGKPIGIFAASFLAVRLGIAKLPENTTWPMVFGLGAVAGIGFTVSIFIAGLSFPGSDLLTEEAKIAILLASLIAAVLGVATLLASTRGLTHDEDEPEDEPDPVREALDG